MALIERNAQVRKQDGSALRRLAGWLKSLRKRKPRIPHLKDLSPHHLRDIGLDPKAIDARHAPLPSQRTHHPRG